ncbi:hypothetical protein DQ04_10211010 [Trypanosoma grayi]|uniref:hypothetical protein n=1 Tax=Trypanosoma grayi TaxID=71804 RepID=UPI0004F495CB|nr:hypothetical protein DQ04_10211010 [Trypanosoma grayi]KEG07313.1 hypothetical protein DQ04_10211010 [Trypanosoma grayi]
MCRGLPLVQHACELSGGNYAQAAEGDGGGEAGRSGHTAGKRRGAIPRGARWCVRSAELRCIRRESLAQRRCWRGSPHLVAVTAETLLGALDACHSFIEHCLPCGRCYVTAGVG